MLAEKRTANMAVDQRMADKKQSKSTKTLTNSSKFTAQRKQRNLHFGQPLFFLFQMKLMRNYLVSTIFQHIRLRSLHSK